MDELKNKLAVFKLKERIGRGILSEVMSHYTNYDHFDVSLTQEFYLIEELVSLLVDNIENGTISTGAYDKLYQNCPECNPKD